ncbi:hypothetical protein Xoosp13_353 [Xanthomonas phage Xoo-sp13]|nr:hypothetical protein Xoosp13_353 [Xanthomonas phage Xoo-sp13]
MNAPINKLLLSYGFITLPSNEDGSVPASLTMLGTFLSNLAYYGYVPSTEVMTYLRESSNIVLVKLWRELEPALKANSGEGRDIGKHVVYKNFPQEVLDMSSAGYWVRQIMMYIGFPNELFTSPEESRAALFEEVTLKVLNKSDGNTVNEIFQQLLANKNRWTDMQSEHVELLTQMHADANLGFGPFIDMDAIGFKENGIRAINNARTGKYSIRFKMTTATDVLRLASVMSGGDAALRESVKFIKFKRQERRALLGMLEECVNINDDFALRPGMWKQLLMVVHPGDYRSLYPRVIAAYNSLYRDELKSFASKVDTQSITKNELKLLASRPGEFLRRFHAVYAVLGKDAVTAFVSILPKLSTYQLVKFRKYLETINTRKNLMIAPKGNWNRAQIIPNTKTPIATVDKATLISEIFAEVRLRMEKLIPEGVALDLTADYVKLQTNDQKLASYGRGTVFPIPDNITFIRAASYWGARNDPNGYNTWMDNAFNVFDENWNSTGTICWDNPTLIRGNNVVAAFSGDPTNSKTADNKACQVIDLYLDKLVESGARYVVWNILSYNDIPFDDVTDIFASLQWGEDAFSGKIYEPSRAQMEFRITGSNKTKYIAYIDLKSRELVYMDANLKGYVQSARNNGSRLSAQMPAYVEYLNTLPSVHDLFHNTNPGSIPVTFSDANLKIETDVAYVFRKENPDNSFKQLDITALLS